MTEFKVRTTIPIERTESVMPHHLQLCTGWEVIDELIEVEKPQLKVFRLLLPQVSVVEVFPILD